MAHLKCTSPSSRLKYKIHKFWDFKLYQKVSTLSSLTLNSKNTIAVPTPPLDTLHFSHLDLTAVEQRHFTPFHYKNITPVIFETDCENLRKEEFLICNLTKQTWTINRECGIQKQKLFRHCWSVTHEMRSEALFKRNARNIFTNWEIRPVNFIVCCTYGWGSLQRTFVCSFVQHSMN